MNNIMQNTLNSPQEEHTFPGLMSSSECSNLIKHLSAESEPYKSGYISTLIISVILWITALCLFFLVSIKTSVYTFPVIFAATAIFFLIVAISNKSKYEERNKRIISLDYTIQINTQFENFIYVGFELKEAYKLTIEWIDRRKKLQALYNIAAENAISAGMIALSNLSRH